MSRLFVGANNARLACTLSSGLTYPITIFFWTKVTWGTNSDAFVALSQDSTLDDNRLIVTNGIGTANRAIARARTTSNGSATLDFTAPETGSGIAAGAADGVWHPVMAVFAGAASRTCHALYPRVAQSNTTSIALSSLDEVVIGQYPSGINDLDGRIAEVCIWNKELTSSDYDTLVTGTATGKKPGNLYPSDVVGYWSFATSALTDESGNGNTLTLTNTADFDADHPTITALETLQAFQYQTRHNTLLRM